jgi:hypothetical protein
MLSRGGCVNVPQDTLAALGGWALLGAFVLVLLVGLLVRSKRLLVLLIVVVEALLVVWIYSLWRLA